MSVQRMNPAVLLGVLGIAGIFMMAGCTSEAPTDDEKRPQDPLPTALFLESAPEGAKPLAEVKSSAKAGDEVTFRCRIGGQATPFVDGRAIMMVIDPSLPPCNEIEGDNCPVPWDYCCETRESLTANKATVQLVDEKGRPLNANLKDNGGLVPLAWLTVVGKVAEKDDAGRFVVNATGVFVLKKS